MATYSSAMGIKTKVIWMADNAFDIAGVLFVPVGSKYESQDENPLEWRISFNVSEKLLVRSWNHTQFVMPY